MKKLLMALMLMPLMALAEMEIVDGVMWSYVVANGKATIMSGTTPCVGEMAVPDTLGGCPVTAIGGDAFSSKNEISKMTLPKGITTIGDYAFASCSSLMAINIPGGVTSIGKCAFGDCRGLTSVTIPEGVTSIGSYVFYGCSGLADQEGFVIVGGVLFDYYGDETSVTIPSSVTNIGVDVFYGCSELTSVTIPSSVKSIGSGAFYGCSGLTRVEIPPCVTDFSFVFPPDIKASVILNNDWTSIAYRAFSKCYGLTSVKIPMGVDSIGDEAFAYCGGLTSVTVPSSVTNIGVNAFYCCSGLADADGFVVVKSVLYDYYGEALSVVIPSNVTSIEADAFYKCSGPVSITVPSSVTSIGENAFNHCLTLSAIVVDSANLRYCSVDGILYEKDEPKLVCCPAEKTGMVTIPEGVTCIGDAAFMGCRRLSSVMIPSSVTNIGESAFYNCDGLTCVTIPGSVTSIGYEAFRNCSGLVVVHVGNDGDVEAVRRMFAASGFDVSGVTFDYVDNPVGELNVVVTNTVTYLGLEGVTNTNVTEFTTNDLPLALGPVEREGHQFVGWSPDDGVIAEGTMSNVTFTANWERKSYVITFETGVELSVQPARRQWHEPMDNLPVLEFPNRQFVGWVTCADGASEVVTASMLVERDVTLYAKWRRSCVVDGREWIYDDVLGCVGICPIHIVGDVAVPEQLDGLPVRNIPEVCFANSSNLVSIAIPASITNIGAYAFYNCVNLKDVVFNEGLISIGDGAFASCESLRELSMPTTVRTLGSRYAFSNAEAVVIEFEEHWEETNSVVECGIIERSTYRGCRSTKKVGRGVFEGCTSLQGILLNEGLERIGAGAFKDCKSLKVLGVPEDVTQIGGGAEFCSETWELNIVNGYTTDLVNGKRLPQSDTGSKERLEYWHRSYGVGFAEGCVALEQVSLPSKLTYLGENAFKNCGALKTVELPDTLKVLMRGTFSGCSTLSAVRFPSNLEVMGAIERMPSVHVVDGFVVGSNGKKCPLADSGSEFIDYEGDYRISTITGANGKTFVVTNADCNVKWLPNSDDAKVPVDEASFSDWFYRWNGAKVLKDVACPLTDDERNKVRMEFASVRPTEPSFESLDNGVFYGCSSLREVCLPQSVRRIADYSFYDCCNLVKIELPKRLDMLGYQVFGGETALMDISTPWFNFCSLWEIFPSHSYVTNLVILSSPPDLMDPNDVFKAVMKDVRGEAFTLEEANARMVPLSDDERRQVGRKILEDLWITQDEVLYGFWNLKSLTLPEGLRSFDWTIGWWSTQKLLDVTLPNTLTGLGLRALAGFPLEYIAIPSSLQTMEDEVFLESNVDDVLFMGNAPCDVSANVFVDASGWDPDYAAREDLVINVYPGTFGWGGDFESATLPTDGLWPAHAAIYKRRPIQFVRQPVSVALGGEGAADALTYFDAAVNRLVTVPQTWLNSYGLLFVDAVGAADVANLSPIVSRTLYDSYVAGLDPTDEESQFKVKIEIVNNEPVVSWEPELSPEEAAKRKYTIYGCTELGGEWHKVEDVSAESRPQFRFFKVGVEMK